MSAKDHRAGHTVLIALAVTAMLFTACARPPSESPGGGTATPSATAPATATPPEATVVTIYYLVDSAGRMWLAPERHEVRDQPRISMGALEELIHGTPQDPDHVTVIPDEARILDLVIRHGVATVDWSAEVLEAGTGGEGEALGIQSIVWTLTEFPSVESVRFTVEGEAKGLASNGRLIEDWWGHVGLYDQPFRRAEAIEVLEPITVWRPLDGDAVGPSFIVEGEASTFEANVQVRIFDQAGDLVQEEFATATEGGPGRGSFRLEIRIQDPPKSVETWRLEAYETNQETGEDFFVESRDIEVTPAWD
jgi:germination protein M